MAKENEDYVDLDRVKKDRKKQKESPDGKPEETEVPEQSQEKSEDAAEKPEAPPEEKIKPEETTKSVFKEMEREERSVKKKRKARTKEFVETDIDKLYEMIRDKGTVKVREASKKLNLDVEQIEEWARILEDHKLIRLHYPPVGDPIFILKKFKADVKEIKKIKKKRKLKPSKKVFVINLAILLAFLSVVAFFTVRLPTIRISFNQLYLVAIVIIIIVVVALVLKFKKFGVSPLPKKERVKKK